MLSDAVGPQARHRSGRRAQLRDLVSDRVLREMHRFLWTGSSVSDTAVDLGWSCRDHAWLAALLAFRLGHAPALIHGSACYLARANAKRGPIEFTQDPHSWVVVDTGALDLSIRPEIVSGGVSYRFPVRSLFANACLPRSNATAHFFDDGADAARAIEDHARRGGGTACVYVARETERLHEGHLHRAAGWIGSALTCYLDATHGDPTDHYLALLRHLCDFIDRQAPSLAGLPFDTAWSRIAATREGALDWALEHFRLPAWPHRAERDQPRQLSDAPFLATSVSSRDVERETA